MQPKTEIRRFVLKRYLDASGVSGTGIVAEGCEFSSGVVAVTWLSPYAAMSMYDNIKALEHVHGHEGATEIIFIDKPEKPKKVKK